MAELTYTRTYYPAHLASRVINVIVSIIELLLALRLVLELLGANPGAAFIAWIYNTSYGLVSPFQGAFPSISLSGNSIIDLLDRPRDDRLRHPRLARHQTAFLHLHGARIGEHPQPAQKFSQRCAVYSTHARTVVCESRVAIALLTLRYHVALSETRLSHRPPVLRGR